MYQNHWPFTQDPGLCDIPGATVIRGPCLRQAVGIRASADVGLIMPQHVTLRVTDVHVFYSWRLVV